MHRKNSLLTPLTYENENSVEYLIPITINIITIFESPNEYCFMKITYMELVIVITMCEIENSTPRKTLGMLARFWK